MLNDMHLARAGSFVRPALLLFIFAVYATFRVYY